LSGSLSPTFPCGIPLELEPDAVEDVAGAAAGVDELEELDPQAATPRAAPTSRIAVNRRVNLEVIVVIRRACVACRGEAPALV
jgi:hypothetical protein